LVFGFGFLEKYSWFFTADLQAVFFSA